MFTDGYMARLINVIWLKWVIRVILLSLHIVILAAYEHEASALLHEP